MKCVFTLPVVWVLSSCDLVVGYQGVAEIKHLRPLGRNSLRCLP